MKKAFSLLLLIAAATSAQTLELAGVKKIWQGAKHSAFGDLIRFQDRWVAVFREGDGHVPADHAGDGRIRVLTSVDGETWRQQALIAEAGVDLRDPHLSVTARGQLMIVAGGSVYENKKYMGRQPRVTFSSDGVTWSAPKKVLEQGHWLWRVTWHDGTAWGISKYGSYGKELAEDPRKANLVRSSDGVTWETVTQLEIPGADEAVVRFQRDRRMVVLMRTRSLQDEMAQIGWSGPPYKDWHWVKQTVHVGGPNFIVLPDGRMIGGGRLPPDKTAIGAMTLKNYEPQLVLPSGGDSSYPGFAWHDGMLWVLYYSSHEGATAIYLAKVRVR